MFEDIGYSREARTIMEKYLVGSLKEDPNKPRAKAADSIESKGGLNPFAIVVLLIAIALGLYFSGKIWESYQ